MNRGLPHTTQDRPWPFEKIFVQRACIEDSPDGGSVVQDQSDDIWICVSKILFWIVEQTLRGTRFTHSPRNVARQHNRNEHHGQHKNHDTHSPVTQRPPFLEVACQNAEASHVGIGEPGEIDDDREMVDGDGTVLPETSDQNGDTEEKLVVAEEKHKTLDDGSPKVFALATDAETACCLQMVKYPAINGIILIASKDSEQVSNEYDR